MTCRRHQWLIANVITYVLKAPRKSQAKAKCMQKCCSSETWPIGLLPALRASEEGAVCAAHLRCMDRSIEESGAATTVARKQAVADGHCKTTSPFVSGSTWRHNERMWQSKIFKKRKFFILPHTQIVIVLCYSHAQQHKIG